MKKLYFLDEAEKNRILNLHESATKRQYLKEDDAMMSDLDEDMGNVATNMAAGAAIGSIIPGVGTVVGGVIGAAAGYLMSASGSSEGVKKMFQSCNAKGMGKSTMDGGTLDQIADEIFDAVDGMGTDENKLKGALSKIVTIPDLCAVKKRYSQNHPGNDLLNDIDGDIDSDSEWNQYVYRPLLNALRKTQELSAKAQQQKPQGDVAANAQKCGWGNDVEGYKNSGWQCPKGSKKTTNRTTNKVSTVKKSTIPSDADLDGVLSKL